MAICRSLILSSISSVNIRSVKRAGDDSVNHRMQEPHIVGVAAEVRQGAFTPVKCTFEGARTETEQALFVCIEKLLASTNTKAKEVHPSLH